MTEPIDNDPMPVFTLKGQDALAIATIGWYMALCQVRGLTEQAEQVWLAHNEMFAWQQRHPDRVKLPDHRHVPIDLTNEPQAN